MPDSHVRAAQKRRKTHLRRRLHAARSPPGLPRSRPRSGAGARRRGSPAREQREAESRACTPGTESLIVTRGGAKPPRRPLFQECCGGGWRRSGPGGRAEAASYHGASALQPAGSGEASAACASPWGIVQGRTGDLGRGGGGAGAPRPRATRGVSPQPWAGAPPTSPGTGTIYPVGLGRVRRRKVYSSYRRRRRATVK